MEDLKTFKWNEIENKKEKTKVAPTYLAWKELNEKFP
jgi:hypothetical protein